MTKLVWDDPSERIFESGVDRGVLYIEVGSPWKVGVAWNGLISVDEVFSEDTLETYFFDGQRHVNLLEVGDFRGVIRAYTFPDELLNVEGSLELEYGLSVDNQDAKPFSMSYRTRIGDAESGLDLGYRVHILYDIVATPTNVSNTSHDNNTNAVEFGWNVSSQPEPSVQGYKPTSHVIIDSRFCDPAFLNYIETTMYGGDVYPPVLYPLSAIPFEDPFIFPGIAAHIIIHDNGDGTWTATAEEPYLTMLNERIFKISGVPAFYTDPGIFEMTVNG
jgi:hypothetical protein